MKYNQGLIKEILLIVIALIILGYFGININNVINSPGVQLNLGWFGHILVTIWSWISGPILWVWNTLIIGVLWHGIQAGVGQAAASSTTP